MKRIISLLPVYVLCEQSGYGIGIFIWPGRPAHCPESCGRVFYRKDRYCCDRDSRAAGRLGTGS